MEAKMKLLIVLTGLMWMFAFAEGGIPLDAVRKNLVKTSSDLSENDVLPDTADNIAVDDKALEIAPETVVEKKVNSTNIDAGKERPVKNKKLNKSLDSLKAAIGKKVKAGKRKIKAKFSYSESDDVVPAHNKSAKRKQQNRTLDLSDIDDVLPDKLKKKYDFMVKQGRGKNVEELTNIRKKLKILQRMRDPKSAAATTNKNDTDVDDLLFQGDQELDAAQLDSIIESTARHHGIDMEPLKKHGVKSSRSKRQAVLAPDDIPVDRLWPKSGAIRWYFDPNVTTATVNIIQQAFNNIENQTCLWFEKNKDYVPRLQFVNWDAPCATSVGHFPNKDGTGIHKVKIGSCLTVYGTISHEILHALGIFHQQVRSDADQYLDDASEILDETNSANFGSPYDYGSVMHYSSFTTTEPKYQQTIGNRIAPTFADIAVLNQRYKCFCKNPTVTCSNGGYPNPDGCDKCICQHGYGGPTCSGIDQGTEELSEVINVDSDECETFEKSLGIENGIQYKYYQKAWYQFKAPSGKKIQFIFVKGADAEETGSDPKKDEWKGCDYNGIEVKFAKSKFNRTGMIFCGNNDQFVSKSNDDIKTFTTAGNIGMLQLYTQRNVINAVVKYRLVDDQDEEVPSSCFPIDDDCENIESDTNCENWNTEPGENCEDDEEWMSENCAKTCGAC